MQIDKSLLLAGRPSQITETHLDLTDIVASIEQRAPGLFVRPGYVDSMATEDDEPPEEPPPAA